MPEPVAVPPEVDEDAERYPDVVARLRAAARAEPAGTPVVPEAATAPEAVYLDAARAWYAPTVEPPYVGLKTMTAVLSRAPEFRRAADAVWAAALSHGQAETAEYDANLSEQIRLHTKMEARAQRAEAERDVALAEIVELKRIGTPEWEEEQATAQAEANSERPSDEEYYEHG